MSESPTVSSYNVMFMAHVELFIYLNVQHSSKVEVTLSLKKINRHQKSNKNESPYWIDGESLCGFHVIVLLPISTIGLECASCRGNLVAYSDERLY
jgi:hypothetical protein